MPTITLPDHHGVPLSFDDIGAGHPVLLLHGGAGPRSVGGFAQALAAQHPARVLTPTHPGFDATPRPDDLTTITQLATTYRELLEHLDLTDVTVVGSSVGRRESSAAIHPPTGRVGSVVLLDAVGLDVPGQAVTDVFGLTPGQIAELTYADPGPYRIDPATFDEAQRAAMSANLATLRTYAGDMTDPDLRQRLGASTRPTLVAWGAADRIVTPDYGRAYADAIPRGRFVLVPGAGHLPQVERPDEVADLVWEFADEHAADGPARDRP
jgi:pimeloyl-ACP methyl ester carboxylesterase